jgi:hypothetical protein
VSGTLKKRESLLVVTALLSLASGCGSRSGLEGFAPDRRQLAVSPPDVVPEIKAPEAAAAQPAPVLEPTPEQRGCVDILRSYDSEPATVLLLIDQSQSMSFPFGESTRWDVLREAILNPENGLLSSLDQNARVGMMLYTGQGGNNNPQGCPLITEVVPRFGNVNPVRTTYEVATPRRGGDTPTGESIDHAVAALQELQGSGPKYILLATDGEPDTCAQPKPSEGMPQALAAAQNAFAQGIRVYTLGVSDGIGAPRLQQLANAGLGKDPALVYGVDPEAVEPLTASSDPRQLANQLKGIIGDVRSCTIDLGTQVGTERTLDGRLVLDGKVLANSATEGWTFVDDRTVEIHGAACDQILGDGQKLEVRFPCVNEFERPR